MSLIKLDTPEKSKRFIAVLCLLILTTIVYKAWPELAGLRERLFMKPTPAVVDPYEGWGEILPGGVVSLRIPPGCKGDPGAGSIYVVCPTESEPEPTPEFVTSSDGMQVNIRRWEGLEVREWDKILASMKLLVPLNRAVQINIEE